MPGSTPPTSQLDWLSSTTAMIVLSWSRATRDLLKSFGWGIAALHRLDCSDEVAISRRPPHSIFWVMLLEKSEYLIAILEDQHDTSSFQGFEIGAFLGKTNRYKSKIFVIYDPDGEPVLPQDVQKIAATPDR